MLHSFYHTCIIILCSFVYINIITCKLTNKGMFTIRLINLSAYGYQLFININRSYPHNLIHMHRVATNTLAILLFQTMNLDHQAVMIVLTKLQRLFTAAARSQVNLQLGRWRREEVKEEEKMESLILLRCSSTRRSTPLSTVWAPSPTLHPTYDCGLSAWHMLVCAY